MSELHKNAIAFLQKRFPSALVLNTEITFSDQNGVSIFKLYPMIAQDMQSGVKQRAIAIENIGSQGEIQAVAQSMGKIFCPGNGGVPVFMRPLSNPKEINCSVIPVEAFSPARPPPNCFSPI